LARNGSDPSGGAPESRAPRFAAFAVAAGLLITVQLAPTDRPLLLLERFIPGSGWLEVVLLALYAAWISGRMLDPDAQPKWRRRVWMAFSVVFFVQLAVGLLGFDRFLMTGELHLPVPALIIAGPLFRMEGLFMLILFCSTALLVGPAWCSHLCYIGAWDHAASRARKRPRPLPAWSRPLRWVMLILVSSSALGLRAAGVSTVVAGGLALAFGLLGVVLMVFWSRRMGAMAHCVVFCPVGLLADLLGKLSPFRVAIGHQCTGCLTCAGICRYDSLNKAQLKKKRPALNCTLCGDCVGACPEGQLHYTLAGRTGPAVRPAFIVLVAVLHAVFLGVARM
jgi:polyferredoxin